ncbi:MAG: cysteine desulfurase [Nanoarchaeota archaeon]|nr:cysteine desulfurase [Nanoarchaeota archaeon]
MNIENIRKDFPILDKKINGRPIVYFDNACVTLKPKQVTEAMRGYYEDYTSCAGRSAHKFGKRVTEEVLKSRKTLQRFVGAKNEKEIVFTRNTTEAINLVANCLNLEKGSAVLNSDKEHNSNLVPWQFLEKRIGIKHEILQGNDDGTFKLDKFEERMSLGNVKLVAMVHISNLDGATNPIKEITKIAHDAGALVLVDAAQAMPHKEIDVRKLNVDFMAFSGHKMLGPSGIGALYAKYHLLDEMSPFMVGGDTVVDTTYHSAQLEKPPEKFEAGLQDYAGIIGFAAAAEYLTKIGKENICKHETSLNRKISEEISSINQLKIIGPKAAEERSGIISFNIGKKNPHDIALMLDSVHNIMIRSGAHCVNSWFNAHNLSGSARASLYLYNTVEETNIFVDSLKKLSNVI